MSKVAICTAMRKRNAFDTKRLRPFHSVFSPFAEFAIGQTRFECHSTEPENVAVRPESQVRLGAGTHVKCMLCLGSQMCLWDAVTHQSTNMRRSLEPTTPMQRRDREERSVQEKDNNRRGGKRVKARKEQQQKKQQRQQQQQQPERGLAPAPARLKPESQRNYRQIQTAVARAVENADREDRSVCDAAGVVRTREQAAQGNTIPDSTLVISAVLTTAVVEQRRIERERHLTAEANKQAMEKARQAVERSHFMVERENHRLQDQIDAFENQIGHLERRLVEREDIISQKNVELTKALTIITEQSMEINSKARTMANHAMAKILKDQQTLTQQLAESRLQCLELEKAKRKAEVDAELAAEALRERGGVIQQLVEEVPINPEAFPPEHFGPEAYVPCWDQDSYDYRPLQPLPPDLAAGRRQRWAHWMMAIIHSRFRDVVSDIDFSDNENAAEKPTHSTEDQQVTPAIKSSAEEDLET